MGDDGKYVVYGDHEQGAAQWGALRDAVDLFVGGRKVVCKSDLEGAVFEILGYGTAKLWKKHFRDRRTQNGGWIYQWRLYLLVHPTLRVPWGRSDLGGIRTANYLELRQILSTTLGVY